MDNVLRIGGIVKWPPLSRPFFEKNKTASTVRVKCPSLKSSNPGGWVGLFCPPFLVGVEREMAGWGYLVVLIGSKIPPLASGTPRLGEVFDDCNSRSRCPALGSARARSRTI